MTARRNLFLLQVSAVKGALEQVSKRLLGQHIESYVADAFTSGTIGSGNGRRGR